MPFMEATSNLHPNGRPLVSNLKRPQKQDEHLFENIFPDSYLGRLLKGLLTEFLIKQEHRMGWARKSACDELQLTPQPNETVAAHQWGVAKLVMVITREPNFQDEIPNFDRLKAIEMALIHDVAELVTGDITPVDGISPAAKHKAEKEAMDMILGSFPNPVQESLHQVYSSYEDRQCIESKFVKDCDKLDFILTAFVLERQGFSGFSEFYTNATELGFHTKVAADLAKTLIDVRQNLLEKQLLYRKSC